MDWIKRVFGKRSDDAVAATHPVTFDTQGWTLVKGDETSAEWRSAGGDTLRGTLRAASVSPLTSAPDLDSLRAAYRDAAARDGEGIIAVERRHATGIASVVAITKSLEIPRNTYKATMVLPLGDRQYTFVMTAREEGVMGFRDAAVMSKMFEMGRLELPRPQAGGSGHIPGYLRDPYDHTYAGPTACSIVDDERLNPLFAQHPLTKLRRWIAQVERSLVVDQSLAVQRGPAAPETSVAAPPRLLPTDVVASVFDAFKQFPQAEQLYGEALDDGTTTTDVERARCHAKRGLSQLAQKAHDRAEQSMANACALYEGALGVDDPLTTQTRCMLARVLMEQRKVADAEAILLAALDSLERSPDMHASSQVHDALATLRIQQKRYRDAVPHLEGGLKALDAAPQTADQMREMMLRNLAYVFKQLDEPDRMVDAWTRAEAIKTSREERQKPHAARGRG